MGKIENHNSLSFWDHLDELRARLVKSAIAVVAGCCIVYYFIDPIISFLIHPVRYLVFNSPAAAFMARVNVSLVGGCIVALPVIFYQLGQFIMQGLKVQEQKYIRIFVPLAVVSFLLGVVFAFFVAFPTSLNFLLGFSNQQMLAMITVKSYFSFLTSFVLAFGIIFELPLVLIFLTKIGIATPAFLQQKRRHAIVLIFIVSAIITPPDVISLLVMAIPLVILYELGVWASCLTYRHRKT